MTLYDKNINTLAQYYPGMDENIKEAKEQGKDTTKIEEFLSEDNERILKITKDGHSCFLAGKRSAKRPPHEWLLEQEDFKVGYTYIFMGIGNIGYLRELIEHVEVRLNIIIYEPSFHIFLKALEEIDLEKGVKKHLILFWVEGVGEMTLDRFDTILPRILRLENLKNLQLFVLPNYDILFKEESEKLIKMCQNAALNNRVAYNTAITFAQVTTVNALRNAKYLCDGYKTIQLFRAVPENTTGIVVAAGPSLNKNIKELKKARGRAFIIAVDTALKPLLRAGIIPDMFFIVDAMKPLDLVDMNGVEQIPMVATLNATPEILDFHKGKKFFFDESYQFAEKIMVKSGLRWGDVATGGSVATNAFSLLYKIGLKTIILVGQDLALTGNKTHADGTFEEKMPEIDTSKYEWVEGNYEEKVPTRTDLHVFLEWYKTSIREYKEHVKDFRVINATEGGAKIEGTELMTLKEAIEQTCTNEIDISRCLEKIEPMLKKENREWAKKYLASIPEQFDKLKTDAVKLRKNYIKIENLCRNNQMEGKQYITLLTKIKKQIRKIESQDVYQLVILTMPSAMQIMRNEEFEQLENMREEGLELARKGKLYTKLVADASELLREESEKIFANINEKA